MFKIKIVYSSENHVYKIIKDEVLSLENILAKGYGVQWKTTLTHDDSLTGTIEHMALVEEYYTSKRLTYLHQ